MKRALVVAAVLALCSLAAQGAMMWNATVLHPSASGYSQAFGTNADWQVGQVSYRAAVWSETAASWRTLQQLGPNSSEAKAISGNQIVGSQAFLNWYEAIKWDAVTGLGTSLHPAGASWSNGYGTSGGQQVGAVLFTGETDQHAVLWSGTPASVVDLHPVVTTPTGLTAPLNGIGLPGEYGPVSSAALATSGGTQAGWIQYGTGGGGTADGELTAPTLAAMGQKRATIWTGTADSAINLHPGSPEQGGGSEALATTDTQQVGITSVPASGGGYYDHATMWSGSAATWVDLHPAFATSISAAYAIVDGYQAGFVYYGGVPHAGLWQGTPESWFDLHPYLPAGYVASIAHGLFVDGSDIYVSGEAMMGGDTHAVLWRFGDGDADPDPDPDIPEPATVSLLLIGGVGMLLRRRRSRS